MHRRSSWRSALLLLVIGLLMSGAPPAAGQGGRPAPPDSPIGNLRLRLASLEELVGPLRSLVREMRAGEVVAVVRKTGVDYVDRATVRESLRLDVLRRLAAEGGGARGPDSLPARNDAFVESAVATLERDIVAESNAHLEKMEADLAWVEERIRQLREELERLEGGPGPQGGGAAPPAGAQAIFDRASHRVCPSPLFGRVLYGASGPRCVSEDMTLFRGSVFGQQDDWVCARCTPNCFFAWDAVASRLICVVTGVPPRPRAARIANPSGSWRRDSGGAASILITGGGPGYEFTGTDGRYKHQGMISGDGSTFEGALKDLPGFCCGREGYAWIEAIDADTFRMRSNWWTPGQGSREKPQLTFGWATWKRGAAGPPGEAAPAQPPPAPEDLSARKKAMGETLNRVRIETRWTPDHHYQVGIWLGNAKSSAELDAIDVLIRDYAGCYATKNAETDRIQAAARAGQYPTPGDRIGALNKVTAVFSTCIDAAIAKRNGAAR